MDKLIFPSRPYVPCSGMVAGTGFASGFLATLAFHQVMLEFLYKLGLTERIPFAFERIPPLGMPAIFSLAFWGGVWGVAFAYVVLLLTGKVNYWGFALLFGAFAPSIVNWFVSAPLHGFPLGSGWHLPEMVTSILVNGAWGVGTALLFRLWFRRHAEES